VFTRNSKTNILSTTAINMIANQTSVSLVATVVPEASLTINGVPVQVGGVNGQIKNAHMALFSSIRSGLPAVAGEYTWIPGTRGSNPNAAWPPKGSRVEFEHKLPCDAVYAEKGRKLKNSEWITITVPYEQYEGTSGFSRRLEVSHNCSGEPLLITDVNVAYLALTDYGYVEFQSDTEASKSLSLHLADGTRVHGMVPYESNAEGFTGLTSGQKYRSYLMAEIFHSSSQPDPAALGGVDRYARESSRFWRLVTPQIEQMVVYVQGICVGGNKEYPEDGQAGSVGYWCYDEEGTQGIKLLIDQTKEMKADLLVFGQNMNQSWRSMIGPEFNSPANVTWFSSLVARAHNSSDGQHPVEVGVYQLLLNARSASALNQAAPGNAIDLPNHWFDTMDPHTGLPDHNGGKAACRGGPSCASLCAGTAFYQVHHHHGSHGFEV
jgi:hypothetical protein